MARKSLAVKSAVKASVPKGLRVSGDFFPALDAVIAHKMEMAVKRAKANGRKTLRPADL
jgi:histone H3/H4